MKAQTVALMVLLAPLLPGCQAEGERAGGVAEPYELDQTIFLGGDILTMEGDRPAYVEAVVQREGRIVFAGSEEDALARFGEKATEHDLKGQTMMPGFIEPHLHPSIAAILLSNDIVAPHDWVLPTGTKKGVSGHDAYVARLEQSVAENARVDDVLYIWGYHPLWHGSMSRKLLNEISPDKPVSIIHRSFHETYLNDKAIEHFGISEADFAGNPQVDWEEGHFFEGGWLALVPKISASLLDPEKYRHGLAQMSLLIQRNGITTIAEQGFPSSSFEMEYGLLKSEMDKKPPYDVYLVPNGTQLYTMQGESNEEALEFIEKLPGDYDTENIFFLPGQIKLFADGAIYSLAMQMEGGYSEGFEGQWMTPLDLFAQQMSFYWDRGFKINVHANGDLGIQMVLDRVAENQERNPREDHRLTLHHMGYFVDEQANQVESLGVEASVNPYYLWALADKYSEHGLGAERAQNMVRIKSLVDRGVPVSLHSDFGMAPVEPLTLAWTAVNRVTSEDTLVSQDQRIGAFTAMQGITINAARTLELEDEIGSIRVGKTANFTILEENPLDVDAMHIKDIPVAGVVYRGRLELKHGELAGADRDAHGCIGSAGYSWCTRTSQCERPWELAKQQSLENTQEAFEGFCDSPAL